MAIISDAVWFRAFTMSWLEVAPSC